MFAQDCGRGSKLKAQPSDSILALVAITIQK
jgi:hypothetical protein